jgi:hypothetical protein
MHFDLCKFSFGLSGLAGYHSGIIIVSLGLPYSVDFYLSKTVLHYTVETCTFACRAQTVVGGK